MTIDIPDRPRVAWDRAACTPPPPEWPVVDVTIGDVTIAAAGEPGGGWVAPDPWTGAYGEGDDPLSAASDLIRSLGELRGHLSGRRDRLSPGLADDLARLCRHPLLAPSRGASSRLLAAAIPADPWLLDRARACYACLRAPGEGHHEGCAWRAAMAALAGGDR